MKDCSKYVGLDVHKETIAVSVAEGNGGEVRYFGEIANTPEAVEKLVRQLRKNGATLSLCYEAGPCGYGLHRQLTDLGWDCQVVATEDLPEAVLERFSYKCTGAAGRFGAHCGVARRLCGSPHGAPHALPCTPNQPASPAHSYGNRSRVMDEDWYNSNSH